MRVSLLEKEKEGGRPVVFSLRLSASKSASGLVMEQNRGSLEAALASNAELLRAEPPPSKRACLREDVPSAAELEKSKSGFELSVGEQSEVVVACNELRCTVEEDGSRSIDTLGPLTDILTKTALQRRSHTLTTALSSAPASKSDSSSNTSTQSTVFRDALARATAARGVGSGSELSVVCALCFSFLHQPVTISCGHSFCCSCLDKYANRHGEPNSKKDLECPFTGCSASFEGGSFKVNSLLSRTLCQWYPKASSSAKFRCEGEQRIMANDFDGAEQMLTDGLELCPGDYHLLTLRAYARFRGQKFKPSLDDADCSCAAHPVLPAAFATRGDIQRARGEYHKAAVDYLHSISLAGTRVEKTSASLTSCLSDVLLGEKWSRQSELVKLAIPIVEGLLREALALPTKSSSQPVAWQIVPAEERKASDIQCAVCLRFYYKPITTPCGHTLCAPCLERLHDHDSRCPWCRAEFPKFFMESANRNVCLALDQLLRTYASGEYYERSEAHREEVRELVRGPEGTMKAPVFICVHHYPFLQRTLRVYEPQYRLLVRRVLETEEKEFAMAYPNPGDNGCVDYGVIVTVADMPSVPHDKQSLYVKVVGKRRVRFVNRQRSDGYILATYEYAPDVKPEDEEQIEALAKLHDEVYDMVERLCAIPEQHRAQVEKYIEKFPARPGSSRDAVLLPDGPAWMWWCVQHLPFNEEAKVSLLSCTSLRDRLTRARQLLTQYQSQSEDQQRRAFVTYCYYRLINGLL